MNSLDQTDLRMAWVTANYYRRAHILAKRPVPAAADRLADHLQAALTVSANGQGSVVAQPDWVSTGEAARQLGCSERTARRLAARVGRRVGRERMIPVDALPGEEETTVD